ncbi:Threonine/homoserine/homoserine lactone efflux protein [Octadecabacter temperatus]|jgi:threonine/homoserine/homoserine lactone efflux protein|uniref:Threonine efflux protein n=1 Tax=Octadecabacter temperatus TaxID=1458307 RepID=A0A0K0Y1M2_9RHOB|nr:LysE family transporter [Octadecabacter temperatus]AKS44781.1 Threonine efflux protein [Octadecabacter temperatus]SIO35329.1 Threonine/homoserine/homoserine lactone efflux protein [Octadecabacter temperatus]
MSDLLFPLPFLLLGWAIGGGSPGPATLTISGTSMAHGRGMGLRLASGVVLGSAIWGIAAALGFSAIMMSNAWLFNLVRYAGAIYLLYLALKSLRSAWQGQALKPQKATRIGAFGKGLALHLTNPKAVLGWGAIYAIALPSDAQPSSVVLLFGALISTSAFVFLGYAVLFSSAPIAAGYARLKRVFDLTFGVLFGAASLKLLTTKLTP